jgi:hypothetical protein
MESFCCVCNTRHFDTYPWNITKHLLTVGVALLNIPSMALMCRSRPAIAMSIWHTGAWDPAQYHKTFTNNEDSTSPDSIAVSLLEGCGEERLMKSARCTSYAGPDRESEVTSRVSVGSLTTSTSATGCDPPVSLHLVMGAGFLPCYFP